ncbi:protocadherin gamma-C5-like [Hemitrygon akajei]|uniref:protocadherin gamma-C5-like n=1 Tax=Hemitrygon akajei TaxID=2704970 RepID=UPI003BF95A43
MANVRGKKALKSLGLPFIVIICALNVVFGQIRYSIPEEMERGSIIGNVAEDLGLKAGTLLARRGRLVSGRINPYAELNLESGVLFVNERMDREQICGSISTCILPFQIVIENSPEMYRGELEIVDINDNSPIFPQSTVALQIAEIIAPGSRFPLESALDLDVGTNAVTTYVISPNEHFSLKVEDAEEGIKIAELLLEKSLDRERQASFQLVLTAVDGGKPRKSGTTQVVITVLDSNDNAPIFDRKIYKASLPENTSKGSPVVTVHASDADEGLNAEVTYSFSNRASKKVQELFSLDPRTGEIRVLGDLDFEEANSYTVDVQAVDRGSPAIAGHSKVLIRITDVNDNDPEIEVNLVTTKVTETAGRGTVIAMINVHDRDSGVNGEVHCKIPPRIPFKLQASSSDHYKLITSDSLDRENTALYNIAVFAWDSGFPPRSTNKTIQIWVSDVNDNAPRFAQSSYTVYVMENNAPGAFIFTAAAVDPDLDQNSYVSYSFGESLIQDLPVSRYLNINSVNGTIYALRSFDYENIKTFQVYVQARDAGVPPLSSTATMNVIILDQNDNAPVIVSPSAESGSAAVEFVPQSVGQGYLVTKVMATDADSGQNARLSYQVQRSTESSLFNIGQSSGEIRTARNILESDATTQTLVIVVKDNGQPSLSSTITILLTVTDNITERSIENSNFVAMPEDFSDLNLYLIVTFGCTSALFLVTIILLIGIKCNMNRNVGQDYNSPNCCYSLKNSNDIFHLRPQVKESLNDNRTNSMVYVTEDHHYSVCLSPESAKTDFLFLRPCSLPISQAQCQSINIG